MQKYDRNDEKKTTDYTSIILPFTNHAPLLDTKHKMHSWLLQQAGSHLQRCRLICQGMINDVSLGKISLLHC